MKQDTVKQLMISEGWATTDELRVLLPTTGDLSDGQSLHGLVLEESLARRCEGLRANFIKRIHLKNVVDVRRSGQSATRKTGLCSSEGKRT